MMVLPWFVDHEKRFRLARVRTADLRQVEVQQLRGLGAQRAWRVRIGLISLALALAPPNAGGAQLSPGATHDDPIVALLRWPERRFPPMFSSRQSIVSL